MIAAPSSHAIWRSASAAIKAAVAAKFGVRVDRIDARDRTQPVALARQVVMWVLRHEFGYSFPLIARTVGRYNHTTAMHGVRVVQQAMEIAPAFAELVRECREAARQPLERGLL